MVSSVVGVVAAAAAVAALAALTAGEGVRGVQFQVRSPQLLRNGTMPARFTCDGANVLPALSVANLPASTAQLAIAFFDEEISLNHWLVYGLSPTLWTGHDEGADLLAAPFNGVSGAGLNSAFRGPCPPTTGMRSGDHVYSFRVYALDTATPQSADMDIAAWEAAVAGNLLCQARLTVHYVRGGDPTVSTQLFAGSAVGASCEAPAGQLPLYRGFDEADGPAPAANGGFSTLLHSSATVGGAASTDAANRLTLTVGQQSVWWQNQNDAPFLYDLLPAGDFSVTTTVRARAESGLPISGGYHYAGPMLRDPASDPSGPQNFAFGAVGFESNTPHFETKATTDGTPSITKVGNQPTTDAHFRLCRVGNTIRYWYAPLANATTGGLPPGATDATVWTEITPPKTHNSLPSSTGDLQVGLMAFSFYFNQAERFAPTYDCFHAERITSFAECSDSARAVCEGKPDGTTGVTNPTTGTTTGSTTTGPAGSSNPPSSNMPSASSAADDISAATATFGPVAATAALAAVAVAH